jgi:hypothetical protein
MSQPSENQQLDPEWMREFTDYLNENSDKKKFHLINKIFIETYFENIRNGLNPKDAMEKAKTTALCFLNRI